MQMRWVVMVGLMVLASARLGARADRSTVRDNCSLAPSTTQPRCTSTAPAEHSAAAPVCRSTAGRSVTTAVSRLGRSWAGKSMRCPLKP